MQKIFFVGKRNVGTLDGDTFSKEVLLSRHHFKVLDAWAMDSSVLNSLPKGSKIVFKSIEEGKWYTTTKEDFKALGTYFHFKEPRQDHKTQLFLKREHFKVESPPVLSPDEQAYQDYKKFL